MSEDKFKEYNINPMILNTGVLNKLKTVKADGIGLLKLEDMISVDVGDRLMIDNLTLSVQSIDEDSQTVFLSEGYFFTEADAIRTLKNSNTGSSVIINKIYKVK
jgi:hypothetical protein